MSIIHDALKRRENPVEEAPEATKEPSKIVTARSHGASPLLSALLAGGGVVAAALITWLATRPAQIDVIAVTAPGAGAQTVVAAMKNPETDPMARTDIEYLPIFSSPPPMITEEEAKRGEVSPSNPPAETSDVPERGDKPTPLPVTATHPTDPANFENPPDAKQNGEKPAAITAGLPTSAGSKTSEASLPVTGGPVTVMRPKSPMAASSSPVKSEEAGASTSRSAGVNGLPENAVTIELSEASLEAVSGSVFAGGRTASRGQKLQVGAVITTEDGGSAALAFSHADVQVVPGSQVRIKRLERRVLSGGAERPEKIEEDAALQLEKGALRLIIPPGAGAMAVSAEGLTARSTNGIFMVIRDESSGTTVSGEAGSVVVTNPADPEEKIVLSAGESVVARNGRLVKKAGKSAEPAEPENPSGITIRPMP